MDDLKMATVTHQAGRLEAEADVARVAHVVALDAAAENTLLVLEDGGLLLVGTLRLTAKREKNS